MRYYDTQEKRLVYIEEKATPQFWDRQWEDDQLKSRILAGANDRFVYPTTKRYLAPGTKILEGGCGTGRFVYALSRKGYETIGIDFAPQTIKEIKRLVPELNVQIGDVRALPFGDKEFDGYWSLGVIEHFPDGYDQIAQEMHRVLKPGGYLFLTFPYMSPLRKLKAAFQSYPYWPHQEPNWDSFYQFALDAETVSEKFRSLGFTLIRRKPYDGFKGLKDESGLLKPLFQRLYNNKSLPAQVLSFALSLLFAPFSSHAVLLILRKR